MSCQAALCGLEVRGMEMEAGFTLGLPKLYLVCIGQVDLPHPGIDTLRARIVITLGSFHIPIIPLLQHGESTSGIGNS